jgi:threonine dehydrogenase-like Zn-dependent dehydrogenase
MRAVRLVGAKELAVEDVAEPIITDSHSAIIDVTATAICGADLLPYWGYVPGFEWGTTMGHEFVGVVREIGPAVSQIKVGDRVVCSSMTSCGTCWYCRRHAQPQCEQRALFGFSGAYPRLDGGQAEQVLIPNADRDLWRLPDDVSDDAAVFVADILSTAYRGVERADVHVGDTVAVVGCGPVGIMAILVARLSAGKVIAIDSVSSRLEMAAKLGAVPLEAGDDVVAAVKAETDARGADAVIECAGGVPALTSALKMARPRGSVSVIGAHFEPDFPLDAGAMFANETTLRISVGAPTDDREEVIGLISNGRIDPTVAISHWMPLEEAPEAYRLFEAREATKVVLLTAAGQTARERTMETPVMMRIG